MSGKSELVIVSNRLPVHRIREGRKNRWKTSPGGLVSALTPILRRRPNTWVGWPGFPGKAPEPFDHDGIHNYAVPLSKRELEVFYEGFANRTLWPLYHDAIRTPEFRRSWWQPYIDVNLRFAEAAAESVKRNGIVWVHDYHLQLAPAMIRELRPDVRIGFFLHIPFPPTELFAQLPWRQQILEGMLGADVVGFQTRIGAQNFSSLVKRFTDATGDRSNIRYQGRRIHAGAFPISIDVDQFESLARSEAVAQHMEQYSQQLGVSDSQIILGVDRMDYTKGIDRRLRAFNELLRTRRIKPGEATFVQIAVPSREDVEEYRELRGQVERIVGEINGEYGAIGRPAVHYIHRGLPHQELVALYRIADVMLVTPFRDGMNLVAKEYCASRIDERGVLILSEFTGSAYELNNAVLVNPHDIDGVATSIEAALQMSPEEQQERMRALRRTIARHTVYDWADSFFNAISRS